MNRSEFNKVFLASINITMFFFLIYFITKVNCHGFQALNQSCILKTNPTWLLCTITFTYYWFQFAWNPEFVFMKQDRMMFLLDLGVEVFLDSCKAAIK
jgi:hypothetical protein